MEILLIRHAHAGERLDGGRDRYRTLTSMGHEQAHAIANALADRTIGSVLASPATRCVQTVEPTATNQGLEVEELEEFWEGSRIDDVMAVLDRIAAAGKQLADSSEGPVRSVVICSHGDIIPEVIERLAHSGVEIQGRGCERASTWVLSHDGRGWKRARYFNRQESTLP